MTKFAQCSTCRAGDGIHCEHFKPLDDSDCPNYLIDYNNYNNEIKEGEYGKAFAIIMVYFSFIAYLFYEYCNNDDFSIFQYGLHLCVLCLFCVIIKYYKELFLSIKTLYQHYKMKKLIANTLKEIGCQYEIDEQKNICFQYQGVHFQIEYNNEESFIVIWNLWWAQIDLDDPDVENLKNAINQTNINVKPTTFYSVNENDKIMGIHCKHTLLFISTIPNLSTYLKVNLESFLITHQQIKTVFNILNDREMGKERVIVRGFR